MKDKGNVIGTISRGERVLVIHESDWNRIQARAKRNPVTGCIECGHTAGNHFGHRHVRIDGRTVYAHRVAYVVNCGAIPAGLLVIHSCDNPKCINPDHLRAGTHQDNMDDVRIRARRRKGTK